MATGSADAAAQAEASDPDERDLFGDVSDEEPGKASAGTASAPAAAAGAEPSELDERELFGSSDEQAEAAPAPGPAPDLGDLSDLDERELFGDATDEEPAKPEAAAAAAPGTGPKETTPYPASEPSELDEREIFGDVSDDEPEKVEDVILRRRPAPSDDREFMSLRLPNVLSVEKTAFRADSIPQALLEGYKQYTNTRQMDVVKLLNPENCIRWRFKKGPDGQNLTDEDGRPLYESNARIVEWEDGTRTLYVGAEAFNMSEIVQKAILFEENSQDIHVCHGILHKRLVATPTSLMSATHEALKRSQFRKVEPMRRSLLLSQEDQAEAQQLQELEMEQRRRQEARPKRAAEAGAGEITAAFLEEDAPAGPSVLDVKRQFKKGRTA